MKTNSNPLLSVIIPSYNEKKNISRGVLDDILDYLKKREYPWELILSDDGSNDGTTQQLASFAKKHDQVQLLKNKHAGKGPTVQSGMLAAKGQWRLFTDFDQSTPLYEVEKLLKYTKNGKHYDVIIGSREIIGAKREKEPWYRHLMGRGFNFLVQFLAIPGILDTQCGFKLLSEKAAVDLFSDLVIYGRDEERKDAFTGAFDVEILFLANKRGYKIREVPIEWKHYHTDRVSPIKDSLRMLIDILKIRFVDIRGKYAQK